MKIFIYSRFGDSYGLAQAIARQHEVTCFIEDKKYRNKGKGIDQPKKVDFWEPYVDKADLILFDMSGKGELAEKLRKRGLPVIGAGSIADRLEEDRAFAMETVKKYCPDVKVPDFKEFSNIAAGIKFLEGQDEPYVFKPESLPTAWTYVPRKDDNAATISIMRSCPKQTLPYVLSKKVRGVEVSQEGWFNGQDWVPGMWNRTMEDKRFLNGDWGPNCGCAGSVAWAIPDDDKLCEILHRPLTGFFREHGYIGPVDINVIVDGKDVYFLEFSARFGYEGIQNLSLLMDDFGETMLAITKGEIPEPLHDGYSLAVRVSFSPYPFTEDNVDPAKSFKGVKVLDVPEDLADKVMMVDVMKNDAGELVLAGVDGVVCTVHAVSDDLDDAIEEVYSTIKKIAITSDLQLRTDIGEGVMEDMEELDTNGWLE